MLNTNVCHFINKQKLLKLLCLLKQYLLHEMLGNVTVYQIHVHQTPQITTYSNIIKKKIIHL